MPSLLAPRERPRPAGPTPSGTRRWWPGFGRVAAVLSALALAALCYAGGAAVMYFGLPSSGYLEKAFFGAEALVARAGPPAGAPGGGLAGAAVTVDRPGDASDGFTLCTTNEGAEAVLVDMRGEVVHRWKMTNGRVWPRSGHVPDPHADRRVHWERCHLYPNGDLLALCCSGIGTPYGFCLAKFDRDSRLLWGHYADVHHALDVGEDGRIYALVQKESARPPAGLDRIPSPYNADYLVVLSPEGRELQSIPILEAFRDSPYFLTLLAGAEGDSGGRGPPGAPFPPPGPPRPPGRSAQLSPGDLLHTNSVRVLSRALAPKFPLFKPGQVLLSLRTPSLLAVLDPGTRRVVWAARGAWQAQHDAQFLDNGRLLLFDNLGSSGGSRVLEYDPVTQAVPWAYPGGQDGGFLAPFRGTTQRLPNGNTLVVDPGARRVFEVTRGGEPVWQWGCPSPADPPDPKAGGEPVNLTAARRYAPDELPFLKGGPLARPR